MFCNAAQSLPILRIKKKGNNINCQETLRSVDFILIKKINTIALCKNDNLIWKT